MQSYQVRIKLLNSSLWHPLYILDSHPQYVCSTLDDPVVMSNLMPWSFFASESWHQGNRWSLCAREICYKGKLLGYAAATAPGLPYRAVPYNPARYHAAHQSTTAQYMCI